MNLQLINAYTISNLILIKRALIDPPGEDPLYRITVGRCKAHNSTALAINIVCFADSSVGRADQYCWRDGKSLFESNTGHLRKLLAAETPELHASILKWPLHLRWQVDIDKLWKSIWAPFRSQKENTFLWQIAYRVIATNGWRFPDLRRSDELTWCTRCTAQTYEDTLHCIWSCPEVSPIWAWIRYFIQFSVPGQHRNITILPTQALLGAPLNFHTHTPSKLWQILRGVACWQIWKSRCTMIFDEIRISLQEVVTKIWFRLKLYLRIEWDSLASKIRSGKITLNKARWTFAHDFGTDPLLYQFSGTQILVSLHPPRMP